MKKFDTLTKDELTKFRSDLSFFSLAPLTGMLAGSLTSNSTLTLSMSALYIAKLITTLYLDKKIIETPNTPERVELMKIYKEVLKDLVKLSKELDNNTVIENHELYTKLLRNDYLCYDKHKGTYKKTGMYELDILPALSINNHGVCRHNAFMEKEYMEKLGFKSMVLVGNSFVGSVDIIEPELYRLYDMGFFDISGLDRKLLEEYIESVKTEKPAPDLAGKEANHAICMTNDKKYSYYLDALNNTIYSKNEKGCYDLSLKNFITNEEELNDFLFVFKSKKIRPKDSLNLPEINHLRDKALDKVNDNLDMLEKFNKEQNDKFERAEEIYQKHLLKRV